MGSWFSRCEREPQGRQEARASIGMEKKDFRVPKEGSCDMERGSQDRRMRFPGGDRGFRGLTERGVEKGSQGSAEKSQGRRDNFQGGHV